MSKKSWFGGGLWKPKNLHSLEQLKYLHTVLIKNQLVSLTNKNLLVETFRQIAEILIWGDQNDPTVFDFFLEKQMQSFFLKIINQKCGSYVCVQLLQTLNILFENIRNETSLYFLLSNNNVNSIIVNRFDFSDDEIMAYYISFLKTLSFKLNPHTIHFFYCEHTHDFPLYTEAIKFFNHPETMVRIAVRTLTLNVYRVKDESMLRFIRDRTAVPYFSNLVWFIGNHMLEIDSCIRDDVDHHSKNRLADLVAEHVDHLHYINDILELNIMELNYVLADHLLNRLLVPLLVYSMLPRPERDDRPRISRVLSFFLLSQTFLIFSFSPLMHILAKIILHANDGIFEDTENVQQSGIKLRPGFFAPDEPLEKSLQKRNSLKLKEFNIETSREDTSNFEDEMASTSTSDIEKEGKQNVHQLNITDEEKQKLIFSDISIFTLSFKTEEKSMEQRPFLRSIFDALSCHENDYIALLSLCLVYALGHNTGLNSDILSFELSENFEDSLSACDSQLLKTILKIVSQSAQYRSKIRVVTLEMALDVLCYLAEQSKRSPEKSSIFLDEHLALLEGAREEATLLLRNFYKGEEIFLDMFEDEWRDLKARPLNVEFLLQDISVLLPPAGTPLTGIDFNKRLPCGEVERARRSMRVFFLIRSVSLKIRKEPDLHLPLTNADACVKVEDVLDLNNSDLIACVVIPREGPRMRRFLVIDILQLILVEPDQRKMGWGVAKLVGFLQDLEVMGDKDDSRLLHVTIHKPSAGLSGIGRPAPPLLAAKFVFDDHIRCMAAKQRLTKGRAKSRQKKLHQIARLLEMPMHIDPCPSPPQSSLTTVRIDQRRSAFRAGADLRSRSMFPRGKFSAESRGPGIASLQNKMPGTSKISLESDTSEVSSIALTSPNSSTSQTKTENLVSSSPVKLNAHEDKIDNGSPRKNGDKSNSGSSKAPGDRSSLEPPKMGRTGARSLSRTRNSDREEIPLENFSKEHNSEVKQRSLRENLFLTNFLRHKRSEIELPFNALEIRSVPAQVPIKLPGQIPAQLSGPGQIPAHLNDQLNIPSQVAIQRCTIDTDTVNKIKTARGQQNRNQDRSKSKRKKTASSHKSKNKSDNFEQNAEVSTSKTEKITRTKSPVAGTRSSDTGASSFGVGTEDKFLTEVSESHETSFNLKPCPKSTSFDVFESGSVGSKITNINLSAPTTYRMKSKQ